MASEERGHLTGVPRFDYLLIVITLALLMVGLVMIWSVTFGPRVGQGATDPQADFIKQALSAGAGLLLMFVLMNVDYQIWGRFALPLMIGTLAVLVALLFTPSVNGARRWLYEGSVQPAELAKFTVILYMAKWLSSKGEKLRQVTYGLMPFAIYVGLVMGLIILQPNLSTAVIIGLCAMAMFFVAGADLVQYLLLLIAGGVTVAVVINNYPYMMSRWAVFMQDPFSSVGRESYQIAETLIALGSGGLVGRGIGSGYSKFGYVPAPHTDSIFALLGEETGLIGTWTVLALYLALVYRGFRIASRAKTPFGQILAAGLTFWLIFQAFVNIAVVTATLPFTGVPLPFISFGGSALISALAAVGVLLNISREDKRSSKEADAIIDVGWRDGRPRVSGPGRRRRDTEPTGRNGRAKSR